MQQGGNKLATTIYTLLQLREFLGLWSNYFSIQHVVNLADVTDHTSYNDDQQLSDCHHHEQHLSPHAPVHDLS